MLRKTNRIELENKEEPDTNDVVVDRGEGNEWWCFKFQCQMDGLFLVSRKH
jgi:hypothetical protein